jgi:hypothetical protein
MSKFVSTPTYDPMRPSSWRDLQLVIDNRLRAMRYWIEEKKLGYAEEVSKGLLDTLQKTLKIFKINKEILSTMMYEQWGYEEIEGRLHKLILIVARMGRDLASISLIYDEIGVEEPKEVRGTYILTPAGGGWPENTAS